MKITKIFFFSFSIILLIFSLNFAKNLKLDASSDTLIQKNDKTFNYFEYYNEIFPSSNFLVLAIKSSKEIDSDYIKKINRIKKEIEKIENIESTFSIVDAPILLVNNIELKDLANQEIENINNTTYTLKKILEEFSKSPIYKNQIINENKNLSSIIIYIKKNYKLNQLRSQKKDLNDQNKLISNINNEYIKEKEKNNIRRELLIKKIRKIINNQNDEYEYFLGGIDMIASDTINFVKNDILVFSIAVICFIIIVLFFIYREIKWVLIPLVTTLYAVSIMTGFISFMNWEVTAISSNYISLMLILSISMNIHIINYYKNNLNKNLNHKTILTTLKKMFWPCFYTALTTIVAFGSLLFSNIKPIIDFGQIMIIALLFILISSFTILPLIISIFSKSNFNKNFKFSLLDIFYNLAIKKYKTIIFVNFLIFALSIIGIYNLNVENSFINYFKSNTQIHKGMKLIDTELGGTTPLDIIVTFKKDEQITSTFDNISDEDELLDLDDGLEFEEDLFATNEDIWFNEEKLEVIKDIHTFLESKNEIGKVQSIYSLIHMGNLINKKPLTIFELSVLYNEIPDNYKEILISPYLSIENNMIKISARVKDSYDIKREVLINDITNYLNNNFDNIDEFRVNGLLVLYNNMLQSLFSSQIKSFGFILISIFIMFLILFRSFKLSIAGIIPNILASAVILGLIGLLKIPLDIMTITIAAITIGIAVDNTIHYIYRFKTNNDSQISKKELIRKGHRSVGQAIMTTSITIAFGFSVLTLSNFIPTILFGTFTALAMLIAMIGVLVTLPSILIKN